MIEQSTYINQKSTANGALNSLPVMESFYTLQGEGFHQGKAAYFIRLGGCDVGCFWCDVKESWDASAHSIKTVSEIVNEVNDQFSKINTGNLKNNHQSQTNNKKPIIVITGGEPLLHDLSLLTECLQQSGFNLHVETSGSSSLSGSWNWICLSPKKFKPTLPTVYAAADELKIVVYNKSDFKWAEENAAQVSADCKLYLQPEWSKRAETIPLIINYIQANPKWQLSLQLHKYINIP